MLNSVAKNIIIRALRIRREHGEDPKTVMKAWPNLTEEEKKEILREVSDK